MLHAQYGQAEEVMLINGPRKLLPYQNRLKTDFKLDARRTFLQKKWIAVGGIRLGVEYRRIHRLGFGFYFLNTRIFDENNNYPIAEDLVEYNFAYNSLYYERVIYFDRKWEFGSGLHLGGGRVNVFYNPDGGNDRVELDKIPFNVIEFSAYGEYNIFYWLGIGLGTGYRNVSGRDESVRKSFSSPIFVANIQLKVFKLAKGLFDESVREEF